ncbi:MAG: aminotransferase class I/II-fold pyridoxal phosphate-dependent enzyme [Fimbriimonadaceae bacterium]|nr:aminotransferase class I/II-fold pyridoxal phosphate-dependent enzyme [Fimbriimonadaceae bacterium]
MPERGFPEGHERFVDLRSDTVTRPTKAMYDAMRDAVLGDDVLGDEPTVARLEALAAEKTGKEAAVFVPSGTMGNQIALACHTQPGDAVIFEEEAHMLYYEVGAPGVLSGVVSWTLPSERGAPDPDEVEKRVLRASLHTPGTRVVCLENSHNRKGGAVIPLETHRAYRRMADRHGIALHLDGARVFNGAVALGVPVRAIAETVDSINFCLSKGLRSPIGSVLCGCGAFIEKARVWRKRLGGGMRQAGLLAACGIVSLTQEVERLAEDHRRAKAIAVALDQLPGISVDVAGVETNIVRVNVDRAPEWSRQLERRGVLCLPFSATVLRLVLHADVDDEQASRAIAAFAEVAAQTAR